MIRIDEHANAHDNTHPSPGATSPCIAVYDSSASVIDNESGIICLGRRYTTRTSLDPFVSRISWVRSTPRRCSGRLRFSRIMTLKLIEGVHPSGILLDASGALEHGALRMTGFLAVTGYRAVDLARFRREVANINDQEDIRAIMG